MNQAFQNHQPSKTEMAPAAFFVGNKEKGVFSSFNAAVHALNPDLVIYLIWFSSTNTELRPTENTEMGSTERLPLGVLRAISR
jgi:hypothetical protein